LECWEVDAADVAVLFGRVGEAAVKPVVVSDVVEDADEFAEPVDVDGVAAGESPPGVEGVEPLLKLWDAVAAVAVEQVVPLVGRRASRSSRIRLRAW
jgi:hypothetical protein